MIKDSPNLKKSLFRVRNSKRFLRLVEAGLRSSKVPFKRIKNVTSLLINKIMMERS
jgi:hypothetical protein